MFRGGHLEAAQGTAATVLLHCIVTYEGTYTHACAYVFVCVCTCACMCVCINVCMYMCECMCPLYWGTLLFTEWYLLFPYPFSQNSDSVSVCAAVVRYSLWDTPRTGVCTTFLQDRCDVSSSIPVFISTNHDFRLPGKGDVPIIMIGPGTGLAPFRAFIQERSEEVFCVLAHQSNAFHSYWKES